MKVDKGEASALTEAPNRRSDMMKSENYSSTWDRNLQDRMGAAVERTLSEFNQAPVIDGQRWRDARGWAIKLYKYAQLDPDQITEDLMYKFGLPRSEVRPLTTKLDGKFERFNPCDLSIPKRRIIRPTVNPEPYNPRISSGSGLVLEIDFNESSGIRLENVENDARLLIAHCFKEGELVAIKGGKTTTPSVVKTREEWLDYLETRPLPQEGNIPKEEQGVWIFINPIKKDALDISGPIHVKLDLIANHRFYLLENDDLSLEQQLELSGFLLPYLQVMIFSGSRSYHCWIRVDAKDAKEYQSIGEQLKKRICKGVSRFGEFGYDKTFYASAHSRMCGAVNGKTDKDQRLIFLTDNPSSQPLWKEEVAS